MYEHRAVGKDLVGVDEVTDWGALGDALAARCTTSTNSTSRASGACSVAKVQQKGHRRRIAIYSYQAEGNQQEPADEPRPALLIAGKPQRTKSLAH